MWVKIFGTKKAAEVSTQEVNFGLIKGDETMLNVDAFTIDFISDCSMLPTVWPDQERKLIEPYRMACLGDDIDDAKPTVDILLGADYVWDVITGPKVPLGGPESNLGLLPSIFGLMLCGRMESVVDSGSVMLCITGSHSQYPTELGLVAVNTKFQEKEPDIDEFWRMETIGIADCPVESDDDKALQSFNESVVYQDGRYHVKMPWIEEKRAILGANYDVALRRMKSLAKRLEADPGLLDSYRKVLEQQLKSGIIEEVPEAKGAAESTTVHCLPHHPVVKVSSETTKVRIVYDASSKSDKKGVCLNDCVMRGPVILPDLCHMLMRFRVHRTVVISDIEKAFLQVALQPTERDVTRFLWFKDDDKLGCRPADLMTYRFCRVAFGIKSSPFLLGATIQHHLRVEGTDFARKLSSDIYVDNVVSGVSEDGVMEYYATVKALFARAGMNLPEFCSNSKNLMSMLPKCDKAMNTDAKVLGVRWDSQNNDSIRVCRPSKWPTSGAETTKRAILQTVASVFDPLGLFQPVTFPAKLLLQQLWRFNLSWDTKIPDKLQEEWDVVREAMAGLFDQRLPRYLGDVNDETTLITFSDASGKGYGTAVYLRGRETNGEVRANLLFAKSRLVPVPKSKSKKAKNMASEETVGVSQPRLELLGLYVGVAAAEFCREAFDTPDMHVDFFVDSECVLHWIRSKRPLKRFVARRVEKIRSMTSCQFHYVGTKSNPADYLTRGKAADELLNDDLWWHGIKFLSKPPAEWPETRLPPVSDEALREISEEPAMIYHTASAVKEDANGLMGLDPVRYSSLNKMLRVTCLMLKFLKNRIWSRVSRETRSGKEGLTKLFDNVSEGEIVASEYQLATILWVRSRQGLCFSDVAETIKNRKKHPLVLQFGIELDENALIRARGRLTQADLDEDAKFPLLLPKDDYVSELVVKEVHNKLGHSGVSHTLNELRRRFWIPHGRAFVKKILRRCIVCRKYKTGAPFALPEMPNFPPERVGRSVPFQYCGVDYFGPMKARVNGSVVKMWASLFTCLATRAVHIEFVVDCTPGEFLNCLIRFISRRGVPAKIVSDNAAQFRLANILGSKAWKRIPSDPSILAYSAENGLEWHFIVELAPWQGGHYERLVGVVKTVLKTAVGRRLLSRTDLVTLLTETEAVVNSRPITYVSTQQ